MASLHLSPLMLQIFLPRSASFRRALIRILGCSRSSLYVIRCINIVDVQQHYSFARKRRKPEAPPTLRRNIIHIVRCVNRRTNQRTCDSVKALLMVVCGRWWRYASRVDDSYANTKFKLFFKLLLRI